jgi:hypothetical protein
VLWLPNRLAGRRQLVPRLPKKESAAESEDVGAVAAAVASAPTPAAEVSPSIVPSAPASPPRASTTLGVDGSPRPAPGELPLVVAPLLPPALPLLPSSSSIPGSASFGPPGPGISVGPGGAGTDVPPAEGSAEIAAPPGPADPGVGAGGEMVMGALSDEIARLMADACASTVRTAQLVNLARATLQQKVSPALHHVSISIIEGGE